MRYVPLDIIFRISTTLFPCPDTGAVFNYTVVVMPLSKNTGASKRVQSNPNNVYIENPVYQMHGDVPDHDILTKKALNRNIFLFDFIFMDFC